MGKRGITGLMVRVGRECYISRGEARLDSGGIQTGEDRGESHSATVRCNGGNQCYRQGCSRGATPEMRAVKSPEFGEGEQ